MNGQRGRVNTFGLMCHACLTAHGDTHDVVLVAYKDTNDLVLTVYKDTKRGNTLRTAYRVACEVL